MFGKQNRGWDTLIPLTNLSAWKGTKLTHQNTWVTFVLPSLDVNNLSSLSHEASAGPFAASVQDLARSLAASFRDADATMIPLCLFVPLNIGNYNVCPLFMFEIKMQNNVGVSNEIQGKRKEDKLSIASGQAAALGKQQNGARVIAVDCTADKVQLPMTALIEVSGDQLDRAAGVGNCRTDKSELTVGVLGSEEAERWNSFSLCNRLFGRRSYVQFNCQPNGIGSTGDIEQNNGLSLPFMKTFSIWQQFESMEVFRKLPQNPHFQPSMKSKRLCREGLAIGNMFAFVSLVEMIAKLEIDAPAELVNDATEALVELEKMGFNVKALRGRLNDINKLFLLLIN
ncbi:hypothetical protein FEM48_Zijuj03G0100900 [Ziziphus jujuba var. spinosa]|uniref:Uncharacterized protein n=1 Tax=Ziziphus jujuba var. spinosa TaxID=714518 RepID=A0A978VPN8_ZIZJJ|nr:hypothetical protein FEM48_Zijuj03G0100900 [Ziziphus jujuba var. spinosa]